MKPTELYSRKPEEISTDLNDMSGGSYGANFPEIYELGCSFWFDDVKQDAVEIHIYKDHCFDGRRTWELRGIFFNSKPVMITRNAGREGDDHCSRFITNGDLFFEMIDYLKGIISKQERKEEEIETFDPEVEITDLVNFYNNKLELFDANYY